MSKIHTDNFFNEMCGLTDYHSRVKQRRAYRRKERFNKRNKRLKMSEYAYGIYTRSDRKISIVERVASRVEYGSHAKEMLDFCNMLGVKPPVTVKSPVWTYKVKLSKYIETPKRLCGNRGSKRWYKHRGTKVVRLDNEVYSGSQYKKLYDLWWKYY